MGLIHVPLLTGDPLPGFPHRAAIVLPIFLVAIWETDIIVVTVILMAAGTHTESSNEAVIIGLEAETPAQLPARPAGLPSHPNFEGSGTAVQLRAALVLEPEKRKQNKRLQDFICTSGIASPHLRGIFMPFSGHYVMVLALG